MRDRPRQHGGGVAQHPDLLRANAGRAGIGDLRPRTLALAAAVAAEIEWLGPTWPEPRANVKEQLERVSAVYDQRLRRHHAGIGAQKHRSEERRVGKEW